MRVEAKRKQGASDTIKPKMIVTPEEWNAGCAFKYEAVIESAHMNDITARLVIPSAPFAGSLTATQERYISTPISQAGWVDATSSPGYHGYDQHRSFRVFVCGNVKNGVLSIGAIIHRVDPIDPAKASSAVLNNSQSYPFAIAEVFSSEAYGGAALTFEPFHTSQSNIFRSIEYLDVVRHGQ